MKLLELNGLGLAKVVGDAAGAACIRADPGPCVAWSGAPADAISPPAVLTPRPRSGGAREAATHCYFLFGLRVPVRCSE